MNGISGEKGSAGKPGDKGQKGDVGHPGMDVFQTVKVSPSPSPPPVVQIRKGCCNSWLQIK